MRLETLESSLVCEELPALEQQETKNHVDGDADGAAARGASSASDAAAAAGGDSSGPPEKSAQLDK